MDIRINNPLYKAGKYHYVQICQAIVNRISTTFKIYCLNKAINIYEIITT